MKPSRTALHDVIQDLNAIKTTIETKRKFLMTVAEFPNLDSLIQEIVFLVNYQEHRIAAQLETIDTLYKKIDELKAKR